MNIYVAEGSASCGYRLSSLSESTQAMSQFNNSPLHLLESSIAVQLDTAGSLRTWLVERLKFAAGAPALEPSRNVGEVNTKCLSMGRPSLQHGRYAYSPLLRD